MIILTKIIMAITETVDRILDAAEILFAEKGFSETSLRSITGKAKVNLAAVNYHFGSKNALIQAVFNRFLSPLNDLMVIGLKENRWGQAGGNIPTIEDVLGLYTRSLLKIPTRHHNGVSIFMRLLGLAYTQSQGHLRKYLEDHKINYEYLHFPRTDSRIFGDLVSRFLRGELGDISTVNPYLISLIYAGDRNDAKDQIIQCLKEDKLVIVDRYV